MRACNCCQQEKPLDDFYPLPCKGIGKFSAVCKRCMLDKQSVQRSMARRERRESHVMPVAQTFNAWRGPVRREQLRWAA